MLKQHDNSGIFCADCGGSWSKYKTKNFRKSIPSKKGIINHSFNLTRDFTKDDFLVELNGKRYGVGLLSEESRLQMKMFSNSKQNPYYDISLLLGLHQYGYQNNYVSIVVPVESATISEREGLYKRLVRDWELTVNGEYKCFSICDLKVFPEGSTAYFVDRPSGKTRYLDLGSRTINFCTVVSDAGGTRFINSESGTHYNAGIEAVNTTIHDYNGGAEIAHYAAGNLLSVWDEQDKVNILGGGALNKGFVETFKSYFPNSTVMNSPQTATIDGLFEISREVYQYASQ